MDKEIAVNFAKQQTDKIPVIFEIFMQNTHQDNYFYMTEEFSTYSYEKEVLLFDGLEFKVIDFQKIFDSKIKKSVVHVKLFNTSINK